MSTDGRVVFAGYSNSTWLVRQASLSNPTQWSILDSYTPEPSATGTAAAALGVVIRPFGEAFIIGNQEASYNDGLFGSVLTRRGNPPVEPFAWTDLLYEAGGNFSGLAVAPQTDGSGTAAMTSRGDVLLGTEIRVQSGSKFTLAWIIRKLGCAQ